MHAEGCGTSRATCNRDIAGYPAGPRFKCSCSRDSFPPLPALLYLPKHSCSPRMSMELVDPAIFAINHLCQCYACTCDASARIGEQLGCMYVHLSERLHFLGQNQGCGTMRQLTSVKQSELHAYDFRLCSAAELPP